MKETKETFLNRIEHCLPPSEVTRIKGAYIFSKFGHRAQKRKEVDENGNQIRYFEHPRRVAIILMDEAHVFDPDLIITALTHDCFEDTVDITPDVLELFFGKKVCHYVMQLTKTDKTYINKISKAERNVVLVKACDRLDNLRSLNSPKITKAFKEKTIKETINSYVDIFRRVLGASHPVVSRIEDIVFPVPF